MKYIFIMNLAILLSSVSINVSHKNRLANTKWQCKVNDDCIDTYNFDCHYKVNFYSCELNNSSYGQYKIIKDTVIISMIDKIDYNKNEKWRFKFIIKDSMLKPISTEELLNNKWEKQKISFDDSYFFTKVKK